VGAREKSATHPSRRTSGVVAVVLACATSAHAMDGGFPAVYAERAQYLLPRGNWEESACFPTGDAGTSCAGAWVPEPRLVDVARELVELRTENATLRASPATPVGVAVALVVGLLVGAGGIGWLWWRFR
jgi:hypothetical protein